MFKLVNEFIKHTETNYKDETNTKTIYIKEIYNILNRCVDNELTLIEIIYLLVDIESKSKKKV